MTPWYLGLSTSGHDPALAIADSNGHIVYAEATERFVQDKRAWGIAPDLVNHLARALQACGADPSRDRFVVSTTWTGAKANVDVNVHDAMLPALDTVWMRGLQAGLQDRAGTSLMRLGVAPERGKRLQHDHHLCHAMTAVWFAPVDDSLVVVLDGEGDVGSVSAYALGDGVLRRLWRSWGPGSLGTFYAWLTLQCGFDWRLGEEWKVMGLAAYGQVLPDLQAALNTMLHVDRGRLRFADDAVLHDVIQMAQIHGRVDGASILSAADLAATGQAAFAGYADRILDAFDTIPGRALILTGGCALNSSYNGTIAGKFGIDEVHVPPCPADDGNAIGAALLGWMKDTGALRLPAQRDSTPFLGVSAGGGLGRARPYLHGFDVEDVTGRSAEAVAQALCAGQIVGTFRGRAEFGPRALGNRSILADPRDPGMKDRLNANVKGREAYRPFAPMVRTRDMPDWFARSQSSPYMSKTLPWRDDRRDKVPAVVHADGTGRAQTVSPDLYPWVTALLDEVDSLTGVPVVLNTSFNVMGKPIVDSLEDALAVLLTTGLDAVLVEDVLIRKPQRD